MTLVCAECQIQFNNWSKASHHQHLTSLLEEITAEMMTNRCPVTAEQALSFWIKITSEGNKKSAEHRSFYRYIPLWYDKNLLLTFKLELNYYLTDYLFTKNDSFFPPKFQSLVVLWFFFFSLNGVSLLLLQVFRRFNEYYFLRLFSHVVGYNNRATNQQIVLLISYS